MCCNTSLLCAGALVLRNARHNYGILAAVWIGTLPIIFIDTTIFYVIWANIFALWGGLWRRVGEVRCIALH